MLVGFNVLVHCRQGRHRSGALCIVVLSFLMHSSLEEAFEQYKERRPDMRDHDFNINHRILGGSIIERMIV